MCECTPIDISVATQGMGLPLVDGIAQNTATGHVYVPLTDIFDSTSTPNIMVDVDMNAGTVTSFPINFVGAFGTPMALDPVTNMAIIGSTSNNDPLSSVLVVDENGTVVHRYEQFNPDTITAALGESSRTSPPRPHMASVSRPDKSSRSRSRRTNEPRRSQAFGGHRRPCGLRPPLQVQA